MPVQGGTRAWHRRRKDLVAARDAVDLAVQGASKIRAESGDRAEAAGIDASTNVHFRPSELHGHGRDRFGMQVRARPGADGRARDEKRHREEAKRFNPIVEKRSRRRAARERSRSAASSVFARLARSGQQRPRTTYWDPILCGAPRVMLRTTSASLARPSGTRCPVLVASMK